MDAKVGGCHIIYNSKDLVILTDGKYLFLGID